MSNISDGDFVTPGQRLQLAEDAEVGDGITRSGEEWIVLRTGTFKDGEKPDVTPTVSIPSAAKEGETFIGEVSRVHAKTAELKILYIEGREDGDRTCAADKMAADIFVSEIVDRFMPSPGDGMRSRDIVRAKIIRTDPMLKASCKGDPELGVLYALCPVCGLALVTSDTVPDENVACNRCDYKGYRALSNGFGNGYIIPDGVDYSALNRGGERWTPEVEGRLGHDGARPYLSPMADYRRGTEYAMPKEARRSGGDDRGGRGGRDGGGGGRREMHKTKCTLCADDCQVPFEPTPGKPVRCRPCMDKVKDGEADKESLAAERKLLIAARNSAQETAGMKLFVGRMPREATADELRELCEAHGKVKSCDIATDREGNPRGYAFVTYSSHEEGAAALKALKGAELHGRQLKFDESTSGGGGGGGRDGGGRGGGGGNDRRGGGGGGRRDDRRRRD
jgi:CxxC-x17-CxxC domain-containing protein